MSATRGAEDRVPAVRASGLVKRFGPTTAVDGVDLVVEPGEVRGLLGPNGAGKTTLLRMLFGLLTPDAGTVSIFGRAGDPLAPHHLDGVAGFVEDPSFYPYLSGRANLEVLAELDGTGRAAPVDEALERVGLGGRAGQRVSGYSTGMRQRLGIAAALLRSPRLLLLDEPTSGLDPAGALDVTAIIRDLAGDGVAVVLSSHQIGEVDTLCATFTMLRAGTVAWDGSAAELAAEAPTPCLRLTTADDRRAVSLAGHHPGLVVDHAGPELLVTGAEDDVDAFVLDLGRQGVAVRRMELLRSPLESVFHAVTTPVAVP